MVGGPASVEAALWVAGIVKNSQVFSNEAREWAGAMYEAMGYRDVPDYPKTRNAVHFRQIMREWWLENRAHFAAKDYAAVKPGAKLASASMEPKPSVPADAIQQPKASAEPPLPTAPAAEPAPAPSPSSPLIYPLAIGLSALLLGTLALFLRRKT